MDQAGLYQAVGGAAACRKLSAAFYARVGRDPILRPLFPGKSLRCATEEFAAFLAQFLGGPSRDAQFRWWLSLRESHLRFQIGPEEREAWMKNMNAALEEVAFPEPAREALRALFNQASAYVVNTGQPSAVAVDTNEPGRPEIHREISRRWTAQRVLDDAVAAVRQGDADGAIALADGDTLRLHFKSNPSVLAAWLVVMMQSGDRRLLDDVSEKLRTNPALAKERFNGRTLLQCAAGEGRPEIVQILLGLGADARETSSGGHTALYFLANGLTNGGADIVRALVEAGADVDACDGVNRCTPLHMAARRGNVEIARALLECGARIEARDSLGDTPLRRAVNRGKTWVAALLTARGADIHSQGNKVLTPLTASRSNAMKQALESRFKGTF